MMGQRRPDLGAVDDEITVFFDCVSLQRGEVGAGVRFGIALTPELLAGQDPAQVTLLLRRGAPMNQRRSEQPDAGSGEWYAGAEAFEFLIADRLVQKRSATAAILSRPGYSEPSAFEQLTMPT